MQFPIGGIFPAAYGLLYKWFPKNERSIVFGLLDFGSNVGAIIATIMTGALSEYGFAGGWPSAFYVSGIIGVVSFLIFAPFVTSTPEQHKMVTKIELNKIQKDNNKDTDDVQAKPRVPWRHILTSRPVLAYVFAKFTLAQTFVTISSKLPTYMADILHIPPTEVCFCLISCPKPNLA